MPGLFTTLDARNLFSFRETMLDTSIANSKIVAKCASRRMFKITALILAFLLYWYVFAVLLGFIMEKIYAASWIDTVSKAKEANSEEEVDQKVYQKHDFLEYLSEKCVFQKRSFFGLTKTAIRRMEEEDLVGHIRRNVLLDLGSAVTVKEYPDGQSLSTTGATSSDKDAGMIRQSNWDPSSGGGFTSRLLIPTFFNKPNVTYHRTFFEAGALDGVFHSTTYYLEKSLGWTGLLAEANQRKIPEIIASGRTSVLAPVCLSPQPRPCLGRYALYHPSEAQKKVPHRFSWYGGLQQNQNYLKRMGPGWRVATSPVDCFPLYSILLAANLTQLDFLSLDLEGAEADVLSTIPWKKVDFKVIRLDLHANDSSSDEAVDSLTSQGYTYHKDLLRNAFASERDSHIFSKFT